MAVWMPGWVMYHQGLELGEGLGQYGTSQETGDIRLVMDRNPRFGDTFRPGEFRYNKKYLAPGRGQQRQIETQDKQQPKLLCR